MFDVVRSILVLLLFGINGFIDVARLVSHGADSRKPNTTVSTSLFYSTSWFVTVWNVDDS